MGVRSNFSKGLPIGRVIALPKCPNCGEATCEGESRCLGCGEVLNDEATPQQAGARTTPDQASAFAEWWSRWSLWLLLGRAWDALWSALLRWPLVTVIVVCVVCDAVTLMNTGVPVEELYAAATHGGDGPQRVSPVRFEDHRVKFEGATDKVHWVYLRFWAMCSTLWFLLICRYTWSRVADYLVAVATHGPQPRAPAWYCFGRWLAWMVAAFYLAAVAGMFMPWTLISAPGMMPVADLPVAVDQAIVGLVGLALLLNLRGRFARAQAVREAQ